MAVTPEGKVKAKVRRILSEFPGLYSYWPVPGGYGKTTLDCLGCYRGRFFSIETKAPGKKPTLRQMQEINGIERAMGKTFVITGEDDPVIGQLYVWLDELSREVDDNPDITPDKVRRRTLRASP